MFKLLSKAESNEKLAKSTGRWILNCSLSLRPADLSGYNVCPWSTQACRNACVLEHAGRGNMPNVRDARDVKTVRFFEDRTQFLADLHADLSTLERQAKRKGMTPCVRLNVASDIPWERIDATLFTSHPSIQFYDYTKGIKRCLSKLPSNYTLTYSYNEESNPNDVASVLDAGINVTVVFDVVYNPAHNDVRPLIEAWTIPGTDPTRRFAVIDGDVHDLRLAELDGKGVIVGLRGKGGEAIVLQGVRGGFIQPVPGGRADINGLHVSRKVTLTVL
jgi:hypothetical protein